MKFGQLSKTTKLPFLNVSAELEMHNQLPAAIEADIKIQRSEFMSKQAIVLHDELRNTVVKSGLWNGGAGNRNFLMSPSVYELPRHRAVELENLGKAVKICFAGINQMTIAMDEHGNGHSPAWRVVRAILNNGVSKTLRSLQKLNPEEESMITKIDLMEDDSGNFQIAEIDGYNPRGMGYSTLAARLSKIASTSGNERLPGVAKSLSEQLKAQGDNKLTFLYADQERFYKPEFLIFKEEMQEFGVEVEVTSELDFHLNGQSRNLLVVFPPLYKNSSLSVELAERYRNGNVSFLIPPKPYLGSKSVLALLKNEEKNEDLENILRNYIPESSLATIRQFIPQTFLVGKVAGKMQGKSALNLTGWQDAIVAEPNKFVLKKSVSSGMKGVFFSDDDKFESTLQEAANSQGHFVIQREVSQLNRHFEYFVSPSEVVSGTWHTRVTAHIIGSELADIVVTARQDKQVHGATDCLQLGTVLV